MIVSAGNSYMSRLIKDKRYVGKKIYAAVALLLVASVLMTATSYAWLVLTRKPEISGVSTLIGTNGNLEIALATTEHLDTLAAANMYEPESPVVYATGDFVHDNVLWGNLLDLTDVHYGLHILNMRPALLNVLNGVVPDAPISLGKYSADGRMEALNLDPNHIDLDKIGFAGTYQEDKAQCLIGTVSMSRADLESGNFNKQEMLELVMSQKQYGVRMAGTLKYDATYDQATDIATVSLLADGYCYCVDMLFRTNAPVGNLMLQTEGIQRMESEYPEEYVGSGSFLQMNNPVLRAAMCVVFADTLTGEVYALAQADTQGKLWITARADENGNLKPTAADDAAMIKPLVQNQVSAVTAWVFLNGELVENRFAATSGDTQMKLNLQFSTDTVLNPAFTDNDTQPNYPNRSDMLTPPGTNVPQPDAPDAPEDFVEPTAGTYYFSDEDNRILDANGRCVGSYGSVTKYENEKIIHLFQPRNFTVDTITDFVVPGVLMVEGEPYQVRISPDFFENQVGMNSSFNLWFQEVDGKKVQISSGSGPLSFANQTNLNYVSLSGLDTSGVTSMEGMFQGCTALKSVSLSGIDTSSVTSMRNMFESCSSMTYLNTIGMDTSAVTDMRSMFSNCSSMSTLSLNHLDTSSVTDMGGMFFNCSSASAIYVNSLDVSAVTDMALMFSYCTGLRTLELSGWDTSNVTDMNEMFSCSSLTSLDLSSFDTSSVMDMNGMFSFCDGLTSLDLSGWDTSNVTDMASMFFRCNGLTSLDLTEFDTANVTDMANMFAESENLTSIDVGGWNTANVTNMRYMFAACSSLTSLDLSSFDTSKVTNMVAMFSNCNNATSIDVSSFDTSEVTDMSSMFAYCYNLSNLDVSDFDTSKVTNMGHKFAQCRSLTSLDLREWNTSSVTSMNNMFIGCSGLTNLKVSGWNTSYVTDMAQMFYGCGALQSLDLSGWNTVSVTNMRAMFYICSRLSSLDLSQFNTANVTNMQLMFSGCNALEDLNISGWNTSKVTDMGNMFQYCNSLTSLDVSSFDTSRVIDFRKMFYHCEKLQELDLSSFDMSGCISIDLASAVDMITGCNALQRLTTPAVSGGENGVITLPGTYQDAQGNQYTDTASVPARTLLTRVA